MKLLPGWLGYLAVTLTCGAASDDTVVLLHGLGRTSFSMARLASELRRDGYNVVNATYASRTHSLETLATEWLPAQLPPCSAPGRVHFVTHSMGAIVLRMWVNHAAATGGVPPNLGRVVMLAPPNAGSEIPDRFGAFPPYRWCTGINGARLGTAATAAPRALGGWPLRDGTAASALGIIAGNKPINALLAATIPLPNDGKVSVASTHLAGETAHIVLPYSHTWLAWRSPVIGQVRAFLATGQFIAPQRT